jgi:hypothetical protein
MIGQSVQRKSGLCQGLAFLKLFLAYYDDLAERV